MVRVDMSEYQDGSVAVDKLIGMPRGIVGSERGGILTNQLKDNPYTVVLLDEVEKASPNLLNLFLQAFDEGWLTDGRGKRVYLSDAVIIMTSNIGSENFRKLTSPLGFLSHEVGVEQVQGEVMRELERRFPPEFRNRIDEVVLFAPLDARRGAGDRPALSRRGQAHAREGGQDARRHRRGARAARDAGLQPGVRRAVPETRHRRTDQAADQRAVEGRRPVRGPCRRIRAWSSSRPRNCSRPPTRSPTATSRKCW